MLIGFQKGLMISKKKYNITNKSSNENYKNGWNDAYLNRVLKKEVEIGRNGTQGYMITQGKNKGKIL
tara:strand:- start:258 stop:458 length:201 start_codon:yes stop_codon:yes gene_type:complete